MTRFRAWDDTEARIAADHDPGDEDDAIDFWDWFPAWKAENAPIATIPPAAIR